MWRNNELYGLAVQKEPEPDSEPHGVVWDNMGNSYTPTSGPVHIRHKDGRICNEAGGIMNCH